MTANRAEANRLMRESEDAAAIAASMRALSNDLKLKALDALPVGEILYFHDYSTSYVRYAVQKQPDGSWEYDGGGGRVSTKHVRQGWLAGHLRLDLNPAEPQPFIIAL